jgi:hypothetical protein
MSDEHVAATAFLRLCDAGVAEARPNALDLPAFA